MLKFSPKFLGEWCPMNFSFRLLKRPIGKYEGQLWWRKAPAIGCRLAVFHEMSGMLPSGNLTWLFKMAIYRKPGLSFTRLRWQCRGILEGSTNRLPIVSPLLFAWVKQWPKNIFYSLDMFHLSIYLGKRYLPLLTQPRRPLETLVCQAGSRRFRVPRVDVVLTFDLDFCFYAVAKQESIPYMIYGYLLYIFTHFWAISMG